MNCRTVAHFLQHARFDDRVDAFVTDEIGTQHVRLIFLSDLYFTAILLNSTEFYWKNFAFEEKLLYIYICNKFAECGNLALSEF